MLNILIATKPDDVDSIYVKLALEEAGHRVVLWYPSDIPTLQSHSFHLSDGEMTWSATGLDFDINASDKFDVVWMRRPRRAKLNDLVHPDDLTNAEREHETFYKSLFQVIAPNAFWVNSPKSWPVTMCKLSQLKVAAKLGFNVPETLVSNDPTRIKKFIASHEAGQVIYKPVFPVMWVNDDVLRLTYTKPIYLSDLPDDKTLKLTPGIYQKRIEKAYELRVTCMGHTAIATKIHSQTHEEGVNDWRCVSPAKLAMEPYSLPEQVATKCFAFMLKMGAVFGCFDFIVTPEGEYIFLEMNEQGQFLWQEEFHSEIKLLDPFVQFLISQNTNFIWKKGAYSATIAHFREAMGDVYKQATSMHVDPGLHI